MARNEANLQTIAVDLRVRGAARVDSFCIDLNDLDRHSKLLDLAENAMSGIDIVLLAHGTH